MNALNRPPQQTLVSALLLGSWLAGAIIAPAATFVVSNLNDNGAGSLRQAVIDSNLLGGSNTIVFSLVGPNSILLWTGELLVTNSLNLVGTGNNNLTIYTAQKTDRVFHITNAAVTISGMTIANGSNFLGGGILQQGGSLILSNCTVVGNSAINGGGIAQTDGALRLINCTISSNTAAGTGMGINVQGSASTTLQRCTLAGNSGTGFTPSGGGISHNGTSLVLDTCTFYANGSTGGDGGGARNLSGNTTITNCTFYANRSFTGGGIAVAGGTVTVRSSIIAGNTSSVSGAGSAPDCIGTFTSGGFNLIGNRTNSTGWLASDLLGTTLSPINPLLDALQPNGGPTRTLEPMLGSPAIDKGHSSGATSDQRGYLRPHDKSTIANAPGGDGADVGAFETGTRTNVVANVNESGPGSLRQAILDAGADDLTTITFLTGIVGNTVSLGQPLYLDKDLVIHGPGASVMALTAWSGQRVVHVVSHKAVISGLTIRDCSYVGEDSSSSFTTGEDVRAGAIINYSDLSLFDCVISNNFIQGGAGANVSDPELPSNGGEARGGAIASYWSLALTRCILANNSAIGGAGGVSSPGGYTAQGGNAYGGGIYSDGNVYVTNCTIYSNAAAGGYVNGISSGGGIYSQVNTLALVSSTIASNAAFSGPGGGIYDGGYTGVFRNSTIAANSAADGGGLYISGSDIGNTIIAGNSAGSAADVQGNFVSSDYNLIQYGNGWVNIGPITYTIIGLDPLLGPLQNNGGPTPTMALQPGSPAIDRGKIFGLTTDQRGRTRPFDYPEFANASGGDGSDIGAFELARPLLSIDRSGANALLSWTTNDPAFQLEATTNPVSPGTWSTVPGIPIVSGNRFTFNEPLQEKKYYRLRNP